MNCSIIIENKIEEITRLSEFIETLGEQLELSLPLVMNLNLVMEEVVTNVILYGAAKAPNQQITISAQKSDNVLIFTVTDHGKEFDPTKAGDADITLSAEERPIGGLGIFLVKKIMNEIEYHRIDGTNIFTLKKEIK